MARTLKDAIEEATELAATLPEGTVTCETHDDFTEIFIRWDDKDVCIIVEVDKHGERWTQHRKGHTPNTYYTEMY